MSAQKHLELRITIVSNEHLMTGDEVSAFTDFATSIIRACKPTIVEMHPVRMLPKRGYLLSTFIGSIYNISHVESILRYSYWQRHCEIEDVQTLVHTNPETGEALYSTMSVQFSHKR